MNKKNKQTKDKVIDIMRKRMKAIILMTCYEDESGLVYGDNEEYGRMEDLINEALKIFHKGIL